MSLSLSSIPSALLAAKQSALRRYFVQGGAEGLTAFAARPQPRHNVVGIGIGRKLTKGKAKTEQCVRFYVEMKIAKQAVPEQDLLPEQIGGIPTDVIQTGRFRSFAATPSEQQFHRPAQPGCSVGFAFAGNQARLLMAGTFGALVEAGGKLFILSNNHVLANENVLAKGSPIYQPGLLDKNSPSTDQIAKLSKFVKLLTTKPNKVDCAIAAVLKKDLVDSTVMPRVGKLSSGKPVDAAEGMPVEKTGRTMSYTTGKITDVAATVKVDYDIGTLTFANQIIIVGSGSRFSDAGNSGSLIVERKSKRPTGLLFAGSSTHTIANHIEDVVKQLEVRIVA